MGDFSKHQIWCSSAPIRQWPRSPPTSSGFTCNHRRKTFLYVYAAGSDKAYQPTVAAKTVQTLAHSWSTMSARSSGGRRRERDMRATGPTRRDVLALAAFGALAGAPARLAVAAGASDGQLTWGVHISLAPIWFDPAEISGIITPFMVLYALHDAMVKPMPGQPLAPSLAQSWSASED